MHRAAHLPRVDFGAHDRAKGADVIEVLTHPPFCRADVRLCRLFRVFTHIVVGASVLIVQDCALLNIDFETALIAFQGVHVVANLALQRHIRHDAQARFRVNAGEVSGVRVAVRVAVGHIEH